MTDPGPPATARLLRLLSLLQTPRDWPGSELAERLRVSPRTIRRDIDRLRDLGYPVEATQGVTGGYRLVAGAAMPPLLLEDDEAVAIVAGLRAAAGPVTEGLGEATVRALAKLERVLPSRLRGRVAALATATTAVSRPGPIVDADVLAELAVAVAGRQYLRFTYRATDGTPSTRRVEPLRLVAARGLWYLVAYDTGRNGWRTFRADRIGAPRASGGRIPERDLPATDAAAYVAGHRDDWGPARTIDVVVHAPAEEAARHLGMPRAALTPDGPDRCRLAGEFADDLGWLAARLVTLGHPFQVHTPDELRHEVRAIAHRATAATTS